MLRLCYIYFEIGYTIERETKGGGAMNVRTFTAVIYKEDDLYVAECPEVGTASQGFTIEESLANLKEATELYLEDFPLPDVSRPLVTTFEATYAA